jgi:translation initiation factor 2B subunit (eIF-2B alpha/beta/delta family)
MARNPVSSLAHAYLDAFSELLHSSKPETALEKFSKIIDSKTVDPISSNALFYVAMPANPEGAKSEILSRISQAKSFISTSEKQLSEYAIRRLRNKDVVAHPLGAFSAKFLKEANSVRFITAEKLAVKILPETDLEFHEPLTAHRAMENADVLLLEPSAVTKEGAIVKHGGRTLAEIAYARNIPVYVLATSWHSSQKKSLKKGEEIVPGALVTGIISEHGIFPHAEFISRVKNDFPWAI